MYLSSTKYHIISSRHCCCIITYFMYNICTMYIYVRGTYIVGVFLYIICVSNPICFGNFCLVFYSHPCLFRASITRARVNNDGPESFHLFVVQPSWTGSSTGPNHHQERSRGRGRLVFRYMAHISLCTDMSLSHTRPSPALMLSSRLTRSKTIRR